MRMRAAVLRDMATPRPYADSQPIQIEEVDLAPPREGEVLVKIAGAGLCHSDLSLINGNRPRPLPLVLGHEGAGEVVDIGPGIRDLKAGDPVVFQFSASCGRCIRCQEGRPQICERHREARAVGGLMGGGSRLSSPSGEVLEHHSGVSCFAEYAVVDRGSAVKVDGDIALDKAAIFGCAVMTGVGAVVNTARLQAGDSVVVIGLGGVGLNGLLGAVFSGAGQIIAVDTNPERLALAQELGATDVVDAGDPEHMDKILDLSHGGVDFAFEFAGRTEALAIAYASLRPGGSVVTAGLPASDQSFSFSPTDLVGSEKSILGSYMGSCVPVRDIPRFIDLYKRGKLPVDALISDTIALDQINAGFDRLADGTTIRQIMVPHVA